MKNKKKICLGAFVILITCILSISFYINKSNKDIKISDAKAIISDMVKASKDKNNDKYISCFVNQYQKSLRTFLKHNPKEPLNKQDYVKLNRIKEMPKSYGKYLIQKKFSDYMGWKETKVVYADITNRKNKRSYYDVVVTKENDELKIIKINPAWIDEVVKKKLGFNDKEEKKAMERQKKEGMDLKFGPDYDYRNYLIPIFNPKISCTYFKPYKELKNEFIYARVSPSIGGVNQKGYLIRDKSALVDIVKGFDKLKCQMPVIKRSDSGFRDVAFVISMWRKRGTVTYVILPKNNSTYYYEEFGLPTRKMPNYMIKLLKLNNKVTKN